MIYLHYRPLAKVLLSSESDLQSRLTTLNRQNIRHYRDGILAQYYADVWIENNHYGKPIAINHADLSFNHSHSQHFYALAYSKQIQDLGVDIEDLARNVRMQALAEHSFHSYEYQTWQATGYSREYWFKVWTIKEAVLKAHGLGIRLSLKSLNTHAHPTWDFGVVEHPQLGKLIYQCFHMANSMLTVAYRAHYPVTISPVFFF